MNYKKKIVKIANDILQDRLGLIEGSRKLAEFQSISELENNKDILFFVGIDSETDYLPVGVVRKKWSKSALMEKDIEIEEIENFYRKKVEVACRRLINNLEK